MLTLYLWSHTERLDLPGLSVSHHDASHHGQDDSKIKQLSLIEEAEMKLFADFLSKMQKTEEGGPTLLDQTVTVHASNLGNASAHTNDNLRFCSRVVAKRAGHLAYDQKDNKPMSNLFIRWLQLGIEMEKFGSSTGVLSEV